MRTTTIADALHAKTNPDAAEARKDALETDMLRELAAACHTLKAPSISNLSLDDHAPAAWLSWSLSHGEPPTLPLDILAALHASGWGLVPATLAKYGQWRPSMHHGTQNSLPATNGRDTLTDSWPAAPVWCEIHRNEHGQSIDAICFMRTLAGRIVRVSVDLPAHTFNLTADRVTAGGKAYTGHNWQKWRYEPGTGRLNVSPAQHEALATLGLSTMPHRVWIDDQHLDGAVYLQLDDCGQDDFRHPATDIVCAFLARP